MSSLAGELIYNAVVKCLVPCGEKEPDHLESKMSSDVSGDAHPKLPSEEALRQQLQLQWQDHFQTREQTWKGLQMVAVILLAVIGADFKLQHPRALLPLGAMVAIASLFGIVVTIHHRKVQIQKFKLIFNLEERLGLHAEGLIEGVRPPEEFRWSGILNMKRIATPTYILLMHLLMLFFVALYVWIRLTS